MLAVHTFEQQVINVFVFASMGAFLMYVFGWWGFDKITKRICFVTELVERKNYAVAIVIGCFLLGIAHIIAAVVGS
jgi:uncharacterized membrane protein YjfL (UPF0719 family)